MSTAHRPNFTAAKARGPNAQRSVQTTASSLPQHSKLKFRAPSTVSSTSASISTGGRDLKRELEEAEWEATNRKRLRDGLEPLPPKVEDGEGSGQGASSRQEMMKKALELDRDSDDSTSSASSSDAAAEDKPEPTPAKQSDNHSSSSSHSSSDSDSDTEDDQTQLLLELQKIKTERAAEKARLSAQTNLSRDQEIAQGNPLLNLQHTFSTPTSNDDVDFAVKKRWDHDVIFKNQSSGAGNTGKDGAKGGFVNDLTRSEFHKKFMNRYIK